MPAAAPQIEVGTFLGTDVMFRFVPAISISTEEIGRFGLKGAGIRHSISQYFPSLPFHLAVQGAVQQLFFDDNDDESIIKLNTWALNVQASKKFGILTLYGGLQAEDSNVKVTYTFEQSALEEFAELDPFEVDLNLDGANTVRAIVGISVAAGPVHLSTDVNLGSVKSASFGLGVSF